MTDEKLLIFIFSNQLLFCSFAGLIGGVVQALELGQNLRIRNFFSKVTVSFSGGILVFFATYDMTKFTPSGKIVTSLVIGYGGSSIFKLMARKYFGNLPPEDDDKNNSQINIQRRRK